MRATAEALDKVKTALIQGYAAKSRKPHAEIAALLTAETWLDAADAVAMGFADQIAEPVKLVASFDIARFRNAPPALAEAVTETVEDDNGNHDAEDEAHAVLVQPAQPDEAIDDAAPDPAGDPAAVATAAAPDAASIRAEAMAHARAVIDLCRLAGQPQMAGRFLEDDASLDDVRTRLLALKADSAPEISSAHAQPGPASTTKPWGEVIARTFPNRG
jgi:hypothetical protein